MKKLIWRWSWVALWMIASLVMLNAIRLSPMALTLTVLSEMPLGSPVVSAAQSSDVDRAVRPAHTLSKMALDESTDVGEEDHASVPFYVLGEFVQLLPESPSTVAIPGVIKGIFKLSNPYAHFWRVTIEGTVVLANGTTQQVLNPRTLWMPPKQTFQHPVQLSIDSRHFMPGLTQFKAILKDDQGRIIDQASISFTLTVDFP